MHNKITKKFLLLFLIVAFLMACASSIQKARYFDSVVRDVEQNNFDQAIQKIKQAKKINIYRKKDRLLYYLDLGILYHYQGDYQQSNRYLEEADRLMEELYTKSISQMAMSFVLNDNAQDYYGEIYENLYLNIFKAINYLKLGSFDDAFVEVKRVDNKLRELEDKYRQMAEWYNQHDTTGVKVHYQPLHFYNDVLAHYLSYLIYRADDRYDDSRIEIEKIHEAWKVHSDVYYFPMPTSLEKVADPGRIYLNVMGFVGQAPKKVAVGGLITTYDGYLGISDLSMPIALPRIPFPGMKAGYHFKFAFPVMLPGRTQVERINVRIDGQDMGTMDLLEDMGKVALKTFRNKQRMIYIKTLIRTVTKGLLAAKAKKKLKKKLKTNSLWGAVIDASLDLAVDATEEPDLRCWKTMPDQCLIGEYPLSEGTHTVDVLCFSRSGQVLYSRRFENILVKKGVNLLNFATLQ